MDLLQYAIEERGKDITDMKNWLGVQSIINVALLEGASREEAKIAILKMINRIWGMEYKQLKSEGVI